MKMHCITDEIKEHTISQACTPVAFLIWLEHVLIRSMEVLEQT